MRIIGLTFATLTESISEKLTTRSKQTNFFSTLAWYKNFVDTVIEEESLQYRFLIAEKSSKIHVILPVKFSTTGSGCRQLFSLSNYYSPIFQIYYDRSPNSTGVTLHSFFKALKTGPVRWDILELRPLSQEDHSFISQQLEKANVPFVPFFCFGNWYLEVNHRSFDEYFSDLCSRVKNTVNRKIRQFEKLEGSKIEIISSLTDLDSAINLYEKIYCSSWKTEESYPEFIRGLVKMAGNQGCLRLGIAYLNDIAIAAQIWIVTDNTAYIFKLAYIEEYKKNSAGSILTAKLLRHVIDIDKVDVVDFLSGDDPYKKEWMSHRRERWGLIAYNTTSSRGKYEMIKAKTRYYLKRYWLYFKRIFGLNNFL